MPSSASTVAPTRPAVFLDRDGTMIVDRHYLGDPNGVELCPGAAQAIARLNLLDLPVIVVTNQSGIGRGMFSEADFWAVQGRLADLLAEEGAHIDAVYFCPHAPADMPVCECRKPAPGLFLKAAAERNIALAKSYYVGDRLRDVQPGLALGGIGILVGSTDSSELPLAGSVVRQVRSLSEAADLIASSVAFD